MIQVDPKSVASNQLILFAFARAVSEGTGFVVNVGDVNLLITNYHVLSGRHPNTDAPLGQAPALPDRVLVPLLRRSATGLLWRPVVQRLFDDNDSPLWVEHPTFGRQFDVVALPLSIPSDAAVVPYQLEPGPNLAVLVGSELAIIGFPQGMSAGGITAIWKAGSVASEPELELEGHAYFWIDSNTRKGMSGAPVIARRFGGALMAEGGYAMHTGAVDRIVGVYAGRALDAPDMTLGRVWKWAQVQEIIAVAASRVRRGILAPMPTLLGHFTDERIPMVQIDITKSSAIAVRSPNGAVENREITVGELLRELILSDDRFGINLERVRMAAAIEAAVSEAEGSATELKLEDSQYSVVREIIDQPSKAYNPVVARQILPLLDYLLNVGAQKDAQ